MLKNKGFTLIELAIVLLIAGVLLASASALLLTYVKQSQLSVTHKRLDSIDEALQLFLELNGRYPCAAPLNAAFGAATFGVEIANLDCDGAAVVANQTTQVVGRGARNVRIGAVPVRTLNLPDDYIADVWGGRFTYAVTSALASNGTYDRTQGAIFVNDSGAGAAPNPVVTFPVPGSAHYVITSHGINNSGATVLAGGGVVACTAGTLENENCDGDATFMNTLLVGNAAGANLYDDIVVSTLSALGDQVPPFAVMAFNLNACPNGWTPFAAANGSAIFGTFAAGDPAPPGAGSLILLQSGGVLANSVQDLETGVLSTIPDLDITSLPPGGGTNLLQSGAGAFTATPLNNVPAFVALHYCQKDPPAP